MKPSFPEPDPLLECIISNEELEELRAASLERMLVVSRQTRRKSKGEGMAVWALAGAALVVLLAGLSFLSVPLLHKSGLPAETTRLKPAMPGSSPSLPSETGVKLISDDELLALFPGRPVALIGPPGKQKLVFLDDSPGPNPL